jgi:hypothetical protein
MFNNLIIVFFNYFDLFLGETNLVRRAFSKIMPA